MAPKLQLGDTFVDRAVLAEICRRYGVKELALFGSASRGTMRSDSDLDLMVEFDPAARIGIVRFQSLADELEGLAHRKVDLVTKGGLKPRIRPHVLSEAQIVYAA